MLHPHREDQEPVHEAEQVQHILAVPPLVVEAAHLC